MKRKPASKIDSSDVWGRLYHSPAQFYLAPLTQVISFSNRPAVESARTRFKEKGLEYRELKVGTVPCIDFPDQYFDAVVYQRTIQQNTLDTMCKIVGEIRRVLKLGGLFLCSLSAENYAQFGKGTVIVNEGFENHDLDGIRHFISQVQSLELFREFNFSGSYVTPSQNNSKTWVVTGVFKLGERE